MKPTILQIDFSDRCNIQCLKSKLLNFRDDIKISYLVTILMEAVMNYKPAQGGEG